MVFLIPLPGQKLLEKIWETIHKSGAGLLEPWQIRRVGRAHTDVARDRALVIAQSERDLDDVRAGRKIFTRDGRLIPVPLSPPDQTLSLPDTTSFVIATAQSAEIERSVRRALNLTKIIAKAEEIASTVSDSVVTDEPVEPDWFARWRDGAEDVSSEELQTLWARILAGEVAKPGAYSLHTVDFLRRVSTADAEIIAKIGGVVIEQWISKGATAYLEEKGIAFATLLFLEDIGILNGASVVVGSLNWTIKPPAGEKLVGLLRCHQKALLVQSPDVNKALELPVLTLTRIGQELITLGEFEPDVRYLGIVAAAIREMGFTVSLCDWAFAAPGEGGKYKFFNETNI